MTKDIYKGYAKQWIIESITIGFAIGLIGFVIVGSGTGIPVLLLLVLFQIAAAIILVYSLFKKIQFMIYEIVEMNQSTHSQSKNDAPMDKDQNITMWNYEVLDNKNDEKSVVLTDGVVSAVFEVTVDGVSPRSQEAVEKYGDDWVDQATAYLEEEFDLYSDET